MAAGDIGPIGEAGTSVPAPKRKRTIFGPIGLVLSLVPWLLTLAMYLIRPGWGSILPALGGLAALGSLGLALVLSVLGLFLDGRKVFAIVGTGIAGLTALGVITLMVVSACIMAAKQ